MPYSDYPKKHKLRTWGKLTFVASITIIITLFIFACSSPGGGGGGGDTTPPTLSSITPNNGSTSVDNNSTTALLLTFSENVIVGTGNIEIRESAGGALFDTIAPAAMTGGGTTTITATLNKTLLGLTGYYVQIPATLFRDAAGNYYAGISDTTTWAFTTLADTAGPVLMGTTPADDATNVLTSLPSLTLTFNEDVTVNGGAADLVIYDGGGGTLASISPASLTGSGTKTITAPFSQPLVDATSYYVNFPADLFRDAAFNNTAGIADNTTWNFTAVADTQAPALVSTTPADETTGVSRTLANLTMTFDKAVYINAGNVTIYKADTTPFRTIPAGSLTVNGSTVTIPVGATFAAGTGYYVQVDAGLIQDKVGNSYAGIADQTTWNFTTILDTTPPQVSSVTPASGGMSGDNPLTVQIDWSEDVIGFDESDITGLSNCTIQALSWTAVSGSRYTFNLIPSSEAAYGFQIDPGVCTDESLNPSTGTTTWTYTYNTAPVVGSFDMTDASDSGSSNSDNITNVTTPSFTGTTSKDGALEIVSDQDGVVYTGAVTAGAWGPVTVGTLTSSGQAGTVHSLTARVTDSHSVTGTSAALSVTIDVTAPTAGQPDLDAASDLGASNSDDVTCDDTPAFSGTSNEAGTLELRNDGSGIVYTGSVTGNWTNRSVSALSGAGQTGTDHLIDARVTDAAGNVGGWSSTISVRIDTTAPTVGSLDMTDASDSGSSNSDNITNVTTPAFTGTTNEDGSFAIVSSVDGAVYTGSVTSGSWGPFTTSTLNSTGQAGRAHTITARLTDLAGNQGTDTLAVTIDTTGPVVGTPDLDTASDSGSSIFDNITNVTTPSFSGTSNEAGTLTIRSSVDGTIYTGAITGNWSNLASTVTLDSTGQTGRAHDIDAQATDVAGNTGSWSSALTIWVDTTAPSVVVSTTAPSPTHISPIPITITYSEPVYGFTSGEVSVTNGTVSNFSCVDGDSVYSCDVTPTGTYNVAVSITVNVGVCTDLAGNNNTAATALNRTYSTIVYLNSGSNQNAGTNTISIAGFNPGTDTNRRILLVFVAARRNSAFTISNVTYGGTAMSLVTGSDQLMTIGANRHRVAWYFMLDTNFPAAASNITATFSGNTTWSKISAYLLDNASQAATPFGTVGYTNYATNATSDTITLNSLTDGSWTLDGAIGTTVGNLDSAGSGQTNLIQMNTTLPGGSSTKALTDAVTSTTMTLGFDISQAQILHNAFEIKIAP
jgi:methionine-rich copper-binding protein CopC